MSPLALLLALAALLAATNAQSNCKTETFGVVTSIFINFDPVTFPPKGGIVSVDDECRKQGKGVAVGNTFAACNADTFGLAPDMNLEYAGTISPIIVTCPDNCLKGGAVGTVQYCA